MSSATIAVSDYAVIYFISQLHNLELLHRAQCGNLPGSGMFLLAANFLRSGMFVAFALARREEVMMWRPVHEDTPFVQDRLLADQHQALREAHRHARRFSRQVCY